MEDPRCCGTGTCIINDDGLCWCGQRWDGERMSFAPPTSAHGEPTNAGESVSAPAQNSAPKPE